MHVCRVTVYMTEGFVDPKGGQRGVSLHDVDLRQLKTETLQKVRRWHRFRRPTRAIWIAETFCQLRQEGQCALHIFLRVDGARSTVQQMTKSPSMVLHQSMLYRISCRRMLMLSVDGNQGGKERLHEAPWYNGLDQGQRRLFLGQHLMRLSKADTKHK